MLFGKSLYIDKHHYQLCYSVKDMCIFESQLFLKIFIFYFDISYFTFLMNLVKFPLYLNFVNKFFPDGSKYNIRPDFPCSFTQLIYVKSWPLVCPNLCSHDVYCPLGNGHFITVVSQLLIYNYPRWIWWKISLLLFWDRRNHL